MRTESSHYFFRGKEARGLGLPRDHGASFKDALMRRSWLAGWDAEDAERRTRARTEEEVREHEEGVEFMKAEMEKWREEMEEKKKVLGS